MNIRHARLVKYTSLAVCVYLTFLYGRTEQTDHTDRGSIVDFYVFFPLKQILDIPVRKQDTEVSEDSSMSTTLASTTSSAVFYSDEEKEMEETNKLEEMGEMKEAIGVNMTDLDVRKETETFLEDNKLRKANIRF